MLAARREWEICGEAGSGPEAIERAKELRPNVIILDIGMPEMNGLDVARRIRAALPQTEVLVLTLHESEQMVREVLAAGARGYVLKSDAGRDLVAAVEALARHKPFFSPGVSEAVLRDYQSANPALRSSAPPRSVLTAREREVLQLLAGGNSNRQTAKSLGISIKTVETHRAHLMEKLGLHSAVEIARYAIRHRLIEP